MRRRGLFFLPPLVLGPRPAAAQTVVTIFAAASLTDGLRALSRQWEARGHPSPRLSFAATSVLARQIAQGAPADLFLSADEPWMDEVQRQGLIVEATRVSPLGNALVLVAPQGAPRRPEAASAMDLPTLLGPRGRLALGDPAHVPAGRYARAALKSLGVWDSVAQRLAPAENVRAALLLVERGEAPLGIVYATDARAAPGVQVVGSFPADSHPPITYPFALTRRAAGNAEARALLAFLSGPEAHSTWEGFGFTTPR